MRRPLQSPVKVTFLEEIPEPGRSCCFFNPVCTVVAALAASLCTPRSEAEGAGEQQVVSGRWACPEARGRVFATYGVA